MTGRWKPIENRRSEPEKVKYAGEGTPSAEMCRKKKPFFAACLSPEPAYAVPLPGRRVCGVR